MRLNIFYRFLFYGLCGVVIEFLFTAIFNLIFHGNLKLEGTSYLYMIPAYGLGLLLLEKLNGFNFWTNLKWYHRAWLYGIGFFIFEILSGLLLKWTIGTIPWDYSGSWCSVFGGLIRLDYFPLWAVYGLVSERVFPIVKRIRITRG